MIILLRSFSVRFNLFHSLRACFLPTCFGYCSKKNLNNSLSPISGLFIWFVLMVCLLMVTSGVTIGVTFPVTVGVTFPVTVTSGVMVTFKVTNASPFVLTNKRWDVLSVKPCNILTLHTLFMVFRAFTNIDNMSRTQSPTFCPLLLFFGFLKDAYYSKSIDKAYQ